MDLDGYFRIVFNDFWHDGSGTKPNDRFKKLNIELSNIKKTGDYIILSEPIEEAKKYIDWITSEEAKKLINNYRVNGKQLFFFNHN